MGNQKALKLLHWKSLFETKNDNVFYMKGKKTVFGQRGLYTKLQSLYFYSWQLYKHAESPIISFNHSNDPEIIKIGWYPPFYKGRPTIKLLLKGFYWTCCI